MPHLAVDVLNTEKKRKRKRGNQADEEDDEEAKRDNASTAAVECWIMILKIGPFNVWSDAVAFLNLWTGKTRGKARRLERGLELYEQYGKEYSLNLWGQSIDKSTALNVFQEQQRQRLPFSVDVEENKIKRTKKPAAQPPDASYAALKKLFTDHVAKEITVQQFKDVHCLIEKKQKK
ncbi:MAG: hypothetical protein K2Q45_00375 [Nitrosomonas sp.]|nr:hypothetical protein [Nitrosomonas sp.]